MTASRGTAPPKGFGLPLLPPAGADALGLALRGARFSLGRVATGALPWGSAALASDIRRLSLGGAASFSRRPRQHTPLAAERVWRLVAMGDSPDDAAVPLHLDYPETGAPDTSLAGDDAELVPPAPSQSQETPWWAMPTQQPSQAEPGPGDAPLEVEGAAAAGGPEATSPVDAPVAGDARVSAPAPVAGVPHPPQDEAAQQGAPQGAGAPFPPQARPHTLSVCEVLSASAGAPLPTRHRVCVFTDAPRPDILRQGRA